MSIETKLSEKRNLLKTKIENKFNTSLSSNSSMKDLLISLNELCEENNIYTTDDELTENGGVTIHTPIGSISQKIITLAGYLSQILNLANITSDINDGFTTLINKIDNITITTKTTPTITLEKVGSSTSVSSGSTITFKATVTGTSENGIPTGSVEFYEGNSSTPFRTVTAPYATNTGTSSFTTTRTHTVSSTTSYTFYAKYVSGNDNYNDSEKSAGVNVTWTYTEPTPSKTDDNVTVSVSGTKTYGNTLTVSATGTGSIKLGTSNGGSDIGTINSGGTASWTPNAGNYTVYATSTGSSTVNSGSASTSVTISKASGSVTLSNASGTISINQTRTISATGQGTVKIGTTSGGTDIASGTNSASGTWKALKGGVNTIYAKSEGNTNYSSADTSSTIGVYSSTQIVQETTTLKYGNSFICYLRDANGNGVSGVSVKIKGTRSDNEYTETVYSNSDSSGKITFGPVYYEWGNDKTINFELSFTAPSGSYYYGTSNSFNVPYKQT